MATKKTLVLGASENPNRYSNMAIRRLRAHGHEVKAIGRRMGMVDDVQIEKEMQPFENIDTVTLYLSAANQREYEDYILSLKPKRIIFNPGAENEALAEKATANGVQPMEACTLVMLNTGQF
ncbi:MAG: CoA-binding protein [Niabella sp.]